MKLLNFKSFKYAFKGLIYCISNEKNMRIHTSIALYVLLFSRFFNLSIEKYMILVLTISAVISAEMVNTATEQICNIITLDYNPSIKIIKNIAAGAVLVFAIASIVVGYMLFWDVDVFLSIFKYFINNLWLSVALLFLTIFVFVYIDIGPLGIKDLLKLKK